MINYLLNKLHGKGQGSFKSIFKYFFKYKPLPFHNTLVFFLTVFFFLFVNYWVNSDTGFSHSFYQCALVQKVQGLVIRS